jgi:hypothetical protein
VKKAKTKITRLNCSYILNLFICCFASTFEYLSNNCCDISLQDRISNDGSVATNSQDSAPTMLILSTVGNEMSAEVVTVLIGSRAPYNFVPYDQVVHEFRGQTHRQHGNLMT